LHSFEARAAVGKLDMGNNQSRTVCLHDRNSLIMGTSNANHFVSKLTQQLGHVRRY